MKATGDSDGRSHGFRLYHQLVETVSFPYSCVIFDMDGTLTRTNDLIFASFNHVAEKYLGKTLQPREIIALFGPPEEGGLAKLLGEETVAEAMDDLCGFYQAHHHMMAVVHPGIESVLDFLRTRGVRLAVFTGKGRRTASITLDAFGLSKYFDLVVSGTDVTQHKPHPEGIQKVLQTFALPPDKALMVGDGLADVKASRAAGVPMASVVWDSYDRDRVIEAGPEFLFYEVPEMLAWLRAEYN